MDKERSENLEKLFLNRTVRSQSASHNRIGRAGGISKSDPIKLMVQHKAGQQQKIAEKLNMSQSAVGNYLRQMDGAMKKHKTNEKHKTNKKGRCRQGGKTLSDNKRLSISEFYLQKQYMKQTLNESEKQESFSK